MSDTMRVWDAVSRTNPANTKHVNQRGGFTAIAAHSQIMEATRAFGPIGEGWGYDTGQPLFQDRMVFVPVQLWHGSRENTFGPVYGGAEWKSNKDHLDSDALKKATTDAMTKLLSQLGFNADVFLGKFDDNKYVAQMEREFNAEPLITDTQKDELQMLCTHLGVPVGDILKVKKIQSLNFLPASSFDGAKAWINARAKEQREKE